MAKTAIPIKRYLDLLTSNGVVPNFYCSEPYLITAHAKAYVENGWVLVEADDWVLFPPIPELPSHPMARPMLLPVLEGVREYPYFPKVHYWSDFINYAPGYLDYESVFLDYEYWYRSADFRIMHGGKWETFRKNCRKWMTRRKGQPFQWLKIYGNDKCTTVEEVLIKNLFHQWVDSHPEGVQDCERIYRFLTDRNLPKVTRYYLFDEDGSLLGMNVTDYTAATLNFRYCISRPGEPYLNEYMRHYLMTTECDYYINDGGCLGDKGLEEFKDKLNPRIKRAVHSWYCTEQ